MYSNKTNSFDSTITVTPIKVDVSMSHSYPTPNSNVGSVAVAATTSVRRSTNQPLVNTTPTVNTSVAFPASTSSITTTISSTGATPKEKPLKTSRTPSARKPPPTLDTFWPNILADVRSIQQVDAKHQALPLARIKKIMKLDENAKMIAAEAPLLFAKACEYFIQELTMRAWIHTEESKRRTLQRSDIAQAIANYDQFDFLIDIVPREDIKPTPGTHKKETQTPTATTTTTTVNTPVATVTATIPSNAATIKLEQPEIITFGTLPQDALTASTSQAQTQPAQQQVQIIQHPQQMQYFITPGPQLVQQLHQQLPNGLTPQITGLNIVTQPQQLILTTGANGQLTATPAPAATVASQPQQQQQTQQIQLLQQVVTPTGELTNVPIAINANQLNLLRLQMQQQQQQQQQQAPQQQQQQQQVIVPAQCLTTQQLIQLSNAQPQQQSSTSNTNIFLSATQPAQVQTTNNSIVSTDRNLGSTFRPNC